MFVLYLSFGIACMQRFQVFFNCNSNHVRQIHLKMRHFCMWHGINADWNIKEAIHHCWAAVHFTFPFRKEDIKVRGMKNQKEVVEIKFNEEEIEWNFLMCNLRFILQTQLLLPPSIWWHITFPPFLMPITSCKFNISSNWMRNVDFFRSFCCSFCEPFFHPSQFYPNYHENMFWNWKKIIRGVQNTWEMSLHIKQRLFYFILFLFKRMTEIAILLSNEEIRAFVHRGGGEMWTFSTLRESIHEKFISLRFLRELFRLWVRKCCQWFRLFACLRISLLCLNL